MSALLMLDTRDARSAMVRVVSDIAGYDAFYKRLIASVPLKNVTSRFAMERIKSTTALPIPERGNHAASRT